MPRLILNPAARADILDAIDWYERTAPAMVAPLRRELGAIRLRIAANPQQFPAGAKDTRRALLRRFPYSLIFRVQADAVYVLAFFHTSRDPAVWHNRA